LFILNSNNESIFYNIESSQRKRLQTAQALNCDLNVSRYGSVEHSSQGWEDRSMQ